VRTALLQPPPGVGESTNACLEILLEHFLNGSF